MFAAIKKQLWTTPTTAAPSVSNGHGSDHPESRLVTVSSTDDALEAPPAGATDKRLIVAGATLTVGFVAAGVVTGGVASVVCLALAGAIFLTAIGSTLWKMHKDKSAGRAAYIDTCEKNLAGANTKMLLTRLVNAMDRQKAEFYGTKEEDRLQKVMWQAAIRFSNTKSSETDLHREKLAETSFHSGMDRLFQWARLHEAELRQHAGDPRYVGERVRQHLDRNPCLDVSLEPDITNLLLCGFLNGVSLDFIKNDSLDNHRNLVASNEAEQA